MLIFGGTVLGLVVFFLATRERPSNAARAASTTSIADVIGGLEVVGESFYQDALDRIAGPKTPDGVEHECEATLVLDDGNAHDRQAVRVEILGEPVAHLSRSSAREYRQALADAGLGRGPHTFEAVVRGGWRRRNGNEGHYGVELVGG